MMLEATYAPVYLLLAVLVKLSILLLLAEDLLPALSCMYLVSKKVLLSCARGP